MTRLFPESEAFQFEGRNVYAGQIVDIDDEVELRHNYTSDVSTVSVSLAVVPAAGLVANLTDFTAVKEF